MWDITFAGRPGSRGTSEKPVIIMVKKTSENLLCRAGPPKYHTVIENSDTDLKSLACDSESAMTRHRYLANLKINRARVLLEQKQRLTRKLCSVEAEIAAMAAGAGVGFAHD